jgi:hypothetical protein
MLVQILGKTTLYLVYSQCPIWSVGLGVVKELQSWWARMANTSPFPADAVNIKYKNVKCFYKLYSNKSTPIKGHPSYKSTPTKGHPSYKATPTKGHPSYKATHQLPIPLIKPLPPKVIPFMRPDLKCTPSYEAKFKMYLDYNKKNNLRGHASYRTTFSLQKG